MAVRSPAWALLAVVWKCSAFAAPEAAPEADAASPFFSRHPVLQFIEQRLPATSTLVVPPDPAQGRQIVTDAALRVAFAAVLEEFLAPPSTFAGKAGDLIGEVCRYRPAQTAEWSAVAADAILRHALPSAEQDLADAVAAAIAARPAAAGQVVSQVLRRIDLRVEAGAWRAAGRLEIEAAGRYAGNVVATAVATVKDAPEAGSWLGSIAEQALEEAHARQANYLVVETISALIKAGAGRVRAGDFARLAFAKFGRSKQQAGIICAGLLKGAGPEAATVIKDEAALNLPVPIAAYTTIVCNAYVAVAGAPAGVPHDISRLITLPNADYIPAVLIGAITAEPGAACEFLRQALNRDLVLHGRATTCDLVEAAVMACEPQAAELAVAAVGHGDLMEGNAPAQIAEGVVRGAPAARISVALAGLLRAQGNSAAELKATVAGAVAGAVAAKKLRVLSAITLAIAAHRPGGDEVLDQVLSSSPAESQAAAVLGVLAGRPDQAGALLDRALKHGDLAAGQAAPIAAGGAVILEIQADPAEFYRAAVRRLAESGKESPEIADAITLGAALANPRGAAAVAAAAVAITELPPERILATLFPCDPAYAGRIACAVDRAVEVKAGSAGLFRLVRDRVAADPIHAAEVVTGAMAVAPALGHVTGHAAALAAPGAVARIVPRLFAFSSVRNAGIAASGDAPEVFAALTRGVMHGVLDARLDPEAESRAVAEVVAAAIKSVIAIGRGRATSAAPAGDEVAAIVAVVGAATGAAHGHAIEIARAAGRTARALSSAAAGGVTIKHAVLAAGPGSEAARIADAVAAGIAEAEKQIPAAAVKALVDYAHDGLTGPPMTRYRDL